MIRGFYINNDVYEIENGKTVSVHSPDFREEWERVVERVAAEAEYLRQVKASEAFGYDEDEEDWEDFEDVDPWDDDSFEDDYDFPWDSDDDWGYNEDEGFDPYEGCYTYDC